MLREFREKMPPGQIFLARVAFQYRNRAIQSGLSINDNET